MYFFTIAIKHVLHQTERHFPFVYVEPSTLHNLRSRQLQQFNSLSKFEHSILPSIWRNIEDMYQKQRTMLKILQKDLTHAKNIQGCRNRQYCEQYMKSILHSNRLAAARAWRYFQDYELKLKSELQRARTKEEQTFIKTFEDGLKFHKEGIIYNRNTAKERQLLLKDQVCKQLEAMGNRFVNHCCSILM